MKPRRISGAGLDPFSRVSARGFTLIELLVSVAIVALLSTGAVSLFEVSARRQKEGELRHDLALIREAIDAYKRAADEGRIAKPADASGYPARLTDLVIGIPDAKSPTKRKQYFLRRLPRDPFADPALAPEESWGLRSYESEPDDPRPGADVFDIHSLSSRTAINGTPYRQW